MPNPVENGMRDCSVLMYSKTIAAAAWGILGDMFVQIRLFGINYAVVHFDELDGNWQGHGEEYTVPRTALDLGQEGRMAY